MKKHYLFVLLSLVIYSAQSQNVGIGTNDPKSKLDINGGLSLREGPVLTLANGGAPGGANDNIVLPDITAGVKAGFYRIVGPTAAFSVYGIVPLTGADGQLVTLVNTTNNAMTIKNNASSTAVNGFKTLTGSDMLSVSGNSSITIQYNKTESRWYVTGSQNYVVTTGSIATGDITTANNAITLTNNTGRLVGTGTMTVDVQNNELNKKGLVPGPTGGNGNQVWGTDNTGNPAWQKVSNSMLNTSSITVANGTGISVSGSPVALGGTVTVTNTAPDQTVVLNNGTGISATGTYPNFTIANTGDLSNTNEAQTIAGAGTSDISLSQAGGAGGGTITLQGTGATTVSRSGNTFTINSSNSGGTVTAVTASNGLNATGTTAVDIKLGGTLTANTTIANGGYTLGITGAGNVGIGTATPGSYRLNVQQGAGNSLFESSSDAPIEIKGTDTWSGIKFTDVAASDYIWYNGGNSTFALGGGGSNVSGKKLHIHGGASVGAGYAASAVPANGLAVEGSVGIGTNTPQNTLHVNGSLRWGGASAAPYTYSSVDPNGLYVEQVGSTAANSKIRFQTSPSGSQSTYAQLYIDPVNGFGFTSSAGGNSGFVGVGTLAPSTNLDVNGNVRIRGGSPAAGMVLTATDANGNATWKDAANTGIKYSGNTVTGNWYRIASNDGTRANAVFTLRDYISSGGHSTLKFQAGSSFNDVSGLSFTLLNHNYYSTPTFTKVRILTKTTYDPQYIEVYVVRDGSVDFSITDNQQANGWVPLSWTAGSLPSGYTANEYEINTLFNIGNNDDRFTVTRTGNVGIGTPTPVSNLQVTGSTTAAVTVSSSNYPSTYKTQLGAQSGAQGILVLGNNAANEIRFGNTAAGGYGSVYVNNTADYNAAATGTLAMFYKADGNVGIGNANPVDKLDVTGHITLSGANKEIRFRNGAGTVEQYVWHSGTSLGLGAGSGNNSMFITAAGNVGVGTGSPNGKFHINSGGAGGVGWGTGFNIGDAANYSGLIQDAGVSRWRNYGTGGYDWYSSGGTQLLALSNAGTLGIRGGSPAADKILTSTNSSGDAVWSNAIRVKPTTESFTVGGSISTFYPVVFTDAAWEDGPMELEIARSNVHTDASWRGALQAKFRSHASSWGHGSEFINAEVYYSQQQFIARYEYNPFSTQFVVWLRGGSTTYTIRANNTTRVTDYSATNKSLVNGWAANAQNTIESYVPDMGTRLIGNVSITGKFKSIGISETSDERYKENISVLTNALQKVKELRGVTYNWRTNDFPTMNFDDAKQVGLIAQEVEKIIPEVVETDKGGFKSVQYGHLVPLLIEALKEQQNIIQSQQQQITTISASTDSRFIELEEKIARLSKLVEPSAQK